MTILRPPCLSFLVLLLWLAPDHNGFGQGVANTAAVSNETSDHQAILATIRSYVDAYNSKDATAVAKHWAPDAVMLALDTGERIQGRDAIRVDLARQFEDQPNATLAVDVNSIRLVTDTVAIEDGLATFNDGVGTVTETAYTVVHVKQADDWKIDSIRETQIPEQTGPQLAELDWMVGRWTDSSDGSLIEFDVKPARNGRFLTMNFRVTSEDAPALEGTQIIGIHPATGKICSWLFDSDGGIGQGKWHSSNGAWVADMSMTLPDGRSASATNIYTPIDATSYKWQSVGRKIDGEFLSDIPAVLVNRAAE